MLLVEITQGQLIIGSRLRGLITVVRIAAITVAIQPKAFTPHVAVALGARMMSVMATEAKPVPVVAVALPQIVLVVADRCVSLRLHVA